MLRAPTPLQNPPRRLVLAAVTVAVAVAVGCAEGQDDPTHVNDLRVLGIRFEPPELQIRGCNPLLLQALAAVDAGLSSNSDGGAVAQFPPGAGQLVQTLSRPIAMTVLIADPSGDGRPLTYRVTSCGRVGDRTCTDEDGFLELARGETTGGELSLSLAPAALVRLDAGVERLPDGGFQPSANSLVQLPDGQFLVQRVLQQDTYKGLGGIRVPVVLEVSTSSGDERIFAQKLMVYTCAFLPQMRANVTPVLPGIRVDGESWGESEMKELSGKRDFEFEPEDFAALEEPYVVPSFQLAPVNLVESWKLSWYATSGTFSALSTGGTNFAGEGGRHRNTWAPNPTAQSSRDVTFFVVTRDGRGGTSWITRKALWTP